MTYALLTLLGPRSTVDVIANSANLVKMRSQTVQTTEGRGVRGVIYHGPKRTASFIVTSVILIARRPQRLPPQPPRQRRHHQLQWWSAAIRVATKSTTVTNTGLTFAQRTVHGPKPTVNVTANSANHVPINCLIVQVTEGALVGGSIFPGHERIVRATAICVARGKSVICGEPE